jgi:hypothetical protein
MDIVKAGCEGGILQTECIVKSGILGVLGAYMVYGLVVCRVAQVDFIRSDSNDGAFSAVHSISIGTSTVQWTGSYSSYVGALFRDRSNL